MLYWKDEIKSNRNNYSKFSVMIKTFVSHNWISNYFLNNSIPSCWGLFLILYIGTNVWILHKEWKYYITSMKNYNIQCMIIILQRWPIQMSAIFYFSCCTIFFNWNNSFPFVVVVRSSRVGHLLSSDHFALPASANDSSCTLLRPTLFYEDLESF